MCTPPLPGQPCRPSVDHVCSFYEWRSPKRTAVSLGMLTALGVLGAFTPVWVTVKAFFFIIGFNFFILTSVADRFPEYRLLASPGTWLFWKIPTHGTCRAQVLGEINQLTPDGSSQRIGPLLVFRRRQATNCRSYAKTARSLRQIMPPILRKEVTRYFHKNWK